MMNQQMGQQGMYQQSGYQGPMGGDFGFDPRNQQGQYNPQMQMGMQGMQGQQSGFGKSHFKLLLLSRR